MNSNINNTHTAVVSTAFDQTAQFTSPAYSMASSAALNWVVADSTIGLMRPKATMNEQMIELFVPGNDNKTWMVHRTSQSFMNSIIKVIKDRMSDDEITKAPAFRTIKDIATRMDEQQRHDMFAQIHKTAEDLYRVSKEGELNFSDDFRDIFPEVWYEVLNKPDQSAQLASFMKTLIKNIDNYRLMY